MHSDFILFADESGDHSLAKINPDYPVFVLSFCIFRKTDYVESVCPLLQRFKLRWWAHDGKRERFMADLTDTLARCPFTIIAAVIDKLRLRDQYLQPENPYSLALKFCSSVEAREKMRNLCGSFVGFASVRDAMNNAVHAPKKEQELEGAKTRLAYLIPSERSPLEVSRNYEDAVQATGGQILFSCKGDTCGGDPNRSSSGGGGDSSLMMYFFVEKELKDASYSNGACAQTSDIADQRFFTAKIPQSSGDTYVTVHTYKVDDDLYCKEFNDRTVALVHILEPKAREQKMVVFKADEMTRTIKATGRIALYGIFFDTDKTDLKPESTPTLTEIAQMMKANPKLAILLVGHTDKQGAYEYNIDLSRRRADAVVKALAASHGVDAKRMRGAGVGMLAPAATNDTEEGRAKNRRVEIVKLN